VAVSSYLSDVAGGMVVGASFPDEASASAALDLLSSSGVRPQDISVIARDPVLAERLAAARAWTPARSARGLMRFAPRRLPAELRTRYGAEMQAGRVVILVAADGQPPDTLAALFGQVKADHVEQWWQTPADLFAPPDLAGPF
jgi:non-ribosomal peptide synthetase component F